MGLEHRSAADSTGEDVKGLSVGEQQLASLRLMIAAPDWAFLDEATSALDVASERKMLSLMRETLPHCTFVLGSAHREPHGMGNVRHIDLDRGVHRADSVGHSATLVGGAGASG